MTPLIRTSFIPALVLLSGCVSKPAVTSPAKAPIVFHEPTAATVEPVGDSVSRPALNKAYYVGRIVDADHPELMHGAGVVFRRERSSTWNTSPYSSPTSNEVQSGPIRTWPTGAETNFLTQADAEIYQARTNQVINALLAQNVELANKLTTLVEQTVSPSPTSGPSTAPQSFTVPSAPVVAAPSHALPPAIPMASAPEEPAYITLQPSAENVIELSPSLLDPPIPGPTNPFRQRFQSETVMKETKVVISALAMGPQPTCVISERLLNKGDSFETFVVDDIDAEGITLRKDSFLLRIPMQDSPITLRYP